MADSLQPHVLQHASLPRPSPLPGACSNPCPLSQLVTSYCPVLCCPLLLPSVFPSIRVFSSELALCIRWPKYQSFSISPSNEYSGLISFRFDWFDLLVVQGTLKSLQHHSSKASVLWCSAFSMERQKDTMSFLYKNKKAKLGIFPLSCTLESSGELLKKSWLYCRLIESVSGVIVIKLSRWF